MSVFSIFTTKKRRQPKKAQPTPTEYYAHLATRLSVLKVALLAVLVCFIAFGFTFYGSELTMENFRYMMKFMSSTVTLRLRQEILSHMTVMKTRFMRY